MKGTTNSLDSRALRYGDTYGLKFARAGDYKYDFGLPGLSRFDDADSPFTIHVRETGDERRNGKQHFVVVRRGTDRARLVADPPEIAIEAGDAILWSAFDSSIPGFTVSGQSANDAFSSAALTHQVVYTHAFGNSGVVHWQDAHHGHVSGTVTVTMPATQSPRELEAYKVSLSKGVMVLIRGTRVEPSEVEIVVGQTVFFAIEDAEGITITDRALARIV